MSDLAIYIHWPFCKSKCPYCDFNSHVRDAVDQDLWRQSLLIELEWMATHCRDHEVSSIFFGGGTPSLMPPQTAAALIERVCTLWPIAENIEITLEANPTSVETNTFADFAKAGVNRVSLGVQSLKEDQLKFLGREHSAGEALEAIERARKIFARYSFDLIYARPGQTEQEWQKELEEALQYAGSHLSLYQLTIEENTAFHHAHAKGDFKIPDEETAEALYCLTEDIMNAHGLPAYEVSNYAKPGEESRHNLAYWKSQPYIGIGPGAHGRLYSPALVAGSGSNKIPDPAIRRGFATQTLKSPERWLSSVREKGNGIEIWQELDRWTLLEEQLMMGLRLTEGIAFEPLREIINEQKQQLFIDQRLLTNQSNRLQATLKGRLVLNHLTAELIA